MKSFIQWLLIVWSIAISAMVLVPSALLLLNQPKPSVFPEPPKPPIAPPWRDGGIDTNALNAYTQQVAAYQQTVTAYNAYIDALKKTDPRATYTLVVKDTLSVFFREFIVALLGFAFVKTVARVFYNISRVKQGQAPEPPRLFE